MKHTNLFLTGIIAALVAACASTKVAQDAIPAFGGAVVEERGAIKKLVLKFAPESPHYEVVHNKENTLSEVRWRSTTDKNFSQEFVFTQRGRGVKKALVVVDTKTNVGTMTLWHDTSDAFSFSRQNAQELVLLPDDPFRQVSSKEDPTRNKRINLNVKGAPLDKVIRTLASESGKSLILGNSVAGSVTVDLKNLTYEQAIDMILRPTGYRAEHAGEVTIIRSAKEDKTFRTFKLRYLDVKEVLKTVIDIASKDAQVSADANSNSLFVIDRFEALKNLEVMLAAMDVEPRQVEVEAAIFDVEKNDNFQFGIDWTGVLKSGKTPGGRVTNDLGTHHLSPIDGSDPAIKGAFVGLTWQSVRAVISAIQTNAKTNLLARPRIVTLSDHEASVIIGGQLGYTTTTFSSTGQAIQNVQFLAIGTQLKIKPHITANNDVLCYIKPEISDGTIDANTKAPVTKTTSAETKVLARNGQTIVLGGLFNDRAEKATDRVPVLGELPIIGAAFGGTTNKSSKRELVILLSPKIVTNELLTAFDQQGRDTLGRFYDENGIEMPVPVGHIAPRQ